MLIPSIDLQAGRVVQLVQGEQLAWSSDDLDGWIGKFAHFPLVQVIDLDAAKGAGSNRDLVEYICGRLPCQVGGGLRSVEAARAMLDAGAHRVIAGSALFTSAGVDVHAVRQFSEGIGREHLVAAIDGRGGRVAVNGWQTTLDLSVADAIAPLEPWVGAFLATLIDGEGKLGGIDMATAEALRQTTQRTLIVAGGIRSMEEVEQLDALGIDAVVGLAVYRGLIEVQGPGSRVQDAIKPRGSMAVVFDFDGVIADSEAHHFRAIQQTTADRGWTLSEPEYYERFLGYSDREVFERMARDRGEPLPAAELDRLIAAKGRAYATFITGGPALCRGAADAIHRLGQHFPLAIASAAFAYEIVQVLESANLRSYFKVIVGAEDVTESKPSPAPYLEAARRLRVPPAACVAIEDSPWGLESARRAGLKAIGITHTYPAARLEAADVIIKSLDEVTEVFVRRILTL